MNKVILIGHLGKNPDVREVSNTKVCTVSLATSEKYKDKKGETIETTDWHNLVFWGKSAEIIGKYCEKGSQLVVEGKSKTRSYEDRDGVKRSITEVLVTSFEFVGGSRQKGSNGQTSSPTEVLPDETFSGDLKDLPF
jgi:single-strand DNA-binding protein